jgi:hypothetical protein
MRRLEAPRVPAWPPAPPPELLTSPPRPPAPWTRAKGLQVALPPQAALRCWRRRGDVGYAAPTDRLFRTPPPPRWGRGGRLPKASEDRWQGRGVRLPGLGHAEAHQSSTTTAIGSASTTTTTTVGLAAANSTLGIVSPRGTSSSSNSSRNIGRPASRVAGRSRAPSEWSPFLFD